MNIKEAINKLDDCYSTIMNMVKDENDKELIESIKPVLEKIDEAQNELENLNLTT